MTNTHSHRGIVWIDLESPTESEISGLVKRYDLHPLVGEELKSSSSVAKIDFYPEYILVVLTLPVRVRNGGTYEIVDRQLDFVIGKTFLITSRNSTIEQLEYFGKVFEANSILNKDEKIDHAGYLFYYMVKRIYAGMAEDLENIKDSLTSAESRIFKGEERNMVVELSNLSRELIDFRQTARMHRDVWEEVIEHPDKSLFGPGFSVYMRDIRDEFNIIHELIANTRELLTDLRETNDSLLNSKQNETMRVLTLATFIFQPITFLAALFTIPALRVPLISASYGWVMILIIMIIMAAGIWWIFKKKRWL